MIQTLVATTALFGLLTIPRVEPRQDADTIANRLLREGETMFDAKDAQGLTESYRSDARIELLGSSGTGFRWNSYEGTAQIRKLYNDLFRNAKETKSRNVVEQSTLIGDRVLLITGTFEPDTSSGLLLQFVQVRIKESDGPWLISSMRLIPIPSP